MRSSPGLDECILGDDPKQVKYLVYIVGASLEKSTGGATFPRMFTRAQLTALQKSRRFRMGRLFLLAREDFIARVAARMDHDGHVVMHARRGLLPFIDVESGTRAIDLARHLGVTKQAVAQMVRDLERDGLVWRDIDEADARASLIRFTEAGLEYLFRLNKSMLQVEREYERLIGKERLAAVRAALAAIAYPGEQLDDPEGRASA